MLAIGADPIVPPIPGLRELDGVWSTREATGMTAVPERLIVLGGGPAGLELAQVVRRLGGEVVLVEGEASCARPRAGAAGEALGEALRRDGIELVLGVHATAARREGDEFVLELADGRQCAAIGCSSPPAGARASTGSGSRPSASPPTPGEIPVDARMQAGERLWAIGDVTGIWQLTHVGEYQGEIVGLEHPRRAP